jgi:hypothetical protein
MISDSANGGRVAQNPAVGRDRRQDALPLDNGHEQQDEEGHIGKATNKQPSVCSRRPGRRIRFVIDDQQVGRFEGKRRQGKEGSAGPRAPLRDLSWRRTDGGLLGSLRHILGRLLIDRIHAYV